MGNKTSSADSPITLYALQTCSHCKDLKGFLQKREISFRVLYVDMMVGDERNDAMRKLRRINPTCSFPTIVVGEKAIVGFKKEEIERALQELSAE